MRAPITTYPAGPLGELVGIQELLKPASPAAGADISFTLPAGYFRRLIGGSAKFTASAAVANRVVAWQYTDGTNLIGSTLGNAPITASQVVTHAFTPGTGGAGNTTALLLQVFSPFQVWLPPGFVIRTTTALIDVADQWSSVALWFESVDFGSYGLPERVHAHTIAQLLETEREHDRPGRPQPAPLAAQGRY